MSKKKETIDPHKLNQNDMKQSSGASNVTEEESNIIKEHYSIIEIVASTIYTRKKLPPAVEFDDLVSAGFDGLLKAIRRFDGKKDVKFSTYANIRIRGEMMDFIRKEWRTKNPSSYKSAQDQIKERVSQVMDVALSKDSKADPKNLLDSLSTAYVISLDQTFEDSVDSNENIEQSAEHKDEYMDLNQIIQSLSPDNINFINLFYRRGLSQKQISIEMNTSEASVSRIHQNVLDQLRVKMASLSDT